ncbi:MAG: efflux RND transporter periplasmic adaptor subunit [Bacteroidales bacterium]|nr:efflux RND transporter periplasmic adaptor subunit [Bacteroidales bacterium]
MHSFHLCTRFGFWIILSSVIILQSCKEHEQKAPYVPDIQVVEVTQSSVPIYSEFVGQSYGLYDIPIRARVEGWLSGIYFDEGSRVVKGQYLYSIESETYEADVAAKMSNVAEAETELVKAQSDLSRIKPLAEMNAVSKSDLDAAEAAAGAAKATVDAAKANLESSKIQLSYAKVYSPISGVIGQTKAKVGEFVGRDPNPVILNTVSSIDTIRVQFFISEDQYLMFAKEYIERYRNASLTDDLKVKKKDLELILSNGAVFPEKGWIDFIDREIDPTTGSMLIQASFPNPERILRPGQFAKVRALLHQVPNAMMIPQRCIMELQGQYNVFVVDSSNAVRSKQVVVGPTIGDQWMVMSGLKVGEKVVYEGLQSVKTGMTVNPKQIDPKAIQPTKVGKDGK